MGERFVSSVACVAVEFCIDIFQTAISDANKTPQSMIGKIILRFSNLNFFLEMANGNMIAVAIAIL